MDTSAKATGTSGQAQPSTGSPNNQQTAAATNQSFSNLLKQSLSKDQELRDTRDRLVEEREAFTQRVTVLRAKLSAVEKERNQLEGLVRNLRTHTSQLEHSCRSEFQRANTLEIQLRDYMMHPENRNNMATHTNGTTTAAAENLLQDQFQQIRRLRQQVHELQKQLIQHKRHDQHSSHQVALAIHGDGKNNDNATGPSVAGLQAVNQELRDQIVAARQENAAEVGTCIALPTVLFSCHGCQSAHKSACFVCVCVCVCLCFLCVAATTLDRLQR